MKRISNNFIINSILTIMLTSLLLITFSYNVVYVFSYNNDGVIYEGNRNKNNITLMFNVYSGTQEVLEILQILQIYNIKTTFFVGGCWVEKNLDTVNLIIEQGHEIGNHGYLHLDQDQLDYNQNYDEIYTCHNLVKVYTGYEMKLFAPPSGAYNNATIKAGQDLGYITIMWSKDTIDWRDQDSNLIYTRATKSIKGGDLVLMHPTPKTVEALPAIIEYLNLQNLNIVPVTHNLLTE